MRFPLSLLGSMSRYMCWQKFFGKRKFPLVLMLEPLHACNLHCSGCGRIREYADTMANRLSVAECVDSVVESGAPIVSICGGEPLIYSEILELVDRVLRLGKHIYLCTNGQLLESKLPDFCDLARTNRRVKSRFYWNVHVDGMSQTHDSIVEKRGAFEIAMRGIAAAKHAGFLVYTNTTLYKQTAIEELVELAELLESAGVDGMMLAPGYGYDAVKVADNENNFFLTRKEICEKFREIRTQLKKFKITATPPFLDFLCGDRTLPCAAWANPTRNVKGWKAPCYLITDKHYETYDQFINSTDWSKIGFGNDSRCENCMMHCGYEPAAVLYANKLTDLIRLAFWQIS
ncbi:MAG: adenosyl-hopene transferase HpnH [Planctomycetaceae bacterium]|nr:adenosyl-hopene transferase HpnH [Planctomycetaceae bacterium]